MALDSHNDLMELLSVPPEHMDAMSACAASFLEGVMLHTDSQSLSELNGLAPNFACDDSLVPTSSPAQAVLFDDEFEMEAEGQDYRFGFFPATGQMDSPPQLAPTSPPGGFASFSFNPETGKCSIAEPEPAEVFVPAKSPSTDNDSSFTYEPLPPLQPLERLSGRKRKRRSPTRAITREEIQTLVSKGLPSEFDKERLDEGEERELKRQRRLIRNRESAHTSRQRRKDYLSTLEEQNDALYERITLLEERNKLMEDQNRKLNSVVNSLKTQLTSAQTTFGNFASGVVNLPKTLAGMSQQAKFGGAACFMIVMFSFAIIFHPGSNGSTTPFRTLRRADIPEVAPGTTSHYVGRQLLTVNEKEKFEKEKVYFRTSRSQQDQAVPEHVTQGLTPTRSQAQAVSGSASSVPAQSRTASSTQSRTASSMQSRTASVSAVPTVSTGQAATVTPSPLQGFASVATASVTTRLQAVEPNSAVVAEPGLDIAAVQQLQELWDGVDPSNLTSSTDTPAHPHEAAPAASALEPDARLQCASPTIAFHAASGTLRPGELPVISVEVPLPPHMMKDFALADSNPNATLSLGLTCQVTDMHVISTVQTPVSQSS